MDTIFALATARGKAGVAVVRISGPSAFSAARLLAGALPQPRCSAVRVLRDPAGDDLDEALVLCFAAGHSFTGEDIVEFHLHGSAATVAAVLRVLGELPDLRLAEPGEFTRRALENGRLDLSQIEGLADLLTNQGAVEHCSALGTLHDNLVAIRILTAFFPAINADGPDLQGWAHVAHRMTDAGR